MKKIRCAIYTRKSTDEGLDMEFNTLAAQREACAAYIKSQSQEGWTELPEHYDDGGFSGGSMERPALKQLLEAVEARRVDVIVVYKIDRLTRSLTDFAKLAESFDAHGVSFVSVTQQFNTTSSMGRLTLNVLLSFAQFEREIAGERIRDKIAASKKKGMWMGGSVPFGYEAVERKLIIREDEAETVRTLFRLYIEKGNLRLMLEEAHRLGLKNRARVLACGKVLGGRRFYRGAAYNLLQNPIYIGKIRHGEKLYPGQHEAIIDRETWKRAQQQLDANRVSRRHRTNAKAPSLLAGVLTDDQGRTYTPSHSNKKGYRYRYYIESIADGENLSRKPKRLPAMEIETAVRDGVAALLASSHKLIGLLGEVADPAHLEAALVKGRRLSQAIAEAAPSALIETLTPLLDSVIFAETELCICLKSAPLHEVLGLPPDEDLGPYEHRIPIQIRTRGVMMKMLIEKDGTATDPDDRLIETLKRAHNWAGQMIAGKSVTEIAEADGQDRSYVLRIIRLAFLAPDIVEAILEGRHPDGLTLKQLTLDSGMPVDWEAQRRYLSFPP